MLQLLLLFFPFVLNAQTCDKALNDPTSELNYFGCNNAGKCTGNRRTRCDCCNKAESTNWCYDRPEVVVDYLFTGTHCTTATYKYAVTFGWRIEHSGAADIQCEDVLVNPPTNGGIGSNPTPNIQVQVNAAMRLLGYPNGIFYGAACQTCRPGNPCDFSNTAPVTDMSMTAGFATELNTYYDPTCNRFNIDTPHDCPANDDLGVAAYDAFVTARGDTESPTMAFTTVLNSLLTGVNPACAQLPPGTCLEWTSSSATVYVQNDLDSQRENFVITTEPPTPDPTPVPTITPAPTPNPTPTPTIPKKCFKYTNRVLDHKFLGSFDNCRGGILDEWPGGKTCESPYIICLPEANTPANPDPTEVPNFGQTLPATEYSVQECLEECAFDQRCMGIELIPAAGSASGECMLIDDIPLVPETKGAWPTSDSEAHLKSGLATTTASTGGTCCPNPIQSSGLSEDACKQLAFGNADINYYSFASVGGGICLLCRTCLDTEFTANALYNTYEISGRLELGNPANYDMITPSKALCFEKQDYCNPFFEASDLNEEMLECYCPNNRKGTYTKKVKRTIANTRYCGEDDDNSINTRIKKAQANRMFHLCENWCLFETHNPRTESWYWDPWHTCWREQYAGVGTHRSYCNRVIRDPMTIEQQFINYRSTNFCTKDHVTGDIIDEITPQPTEAPVQFPSAKWELADEEDSCDDMCESIGKKCDELTTASLVDGEDIGAALDEASPGTTCTKTETGAEGWALPGIYKDGTCITRNSNTAYTGCNWALGVGYRRLCSCYTP